MVRVMCAPLMIGKNEFKLFLYHSWWFFMLRNPTIVGKYHSLMLGMMISTWLYSFFWKSHRRNGNANSSWDGILVMILSPNMLISWKVISNTIIPPKSDRVTFLLAKPQNALDARFFWEKKMNLNNKWSINATRTLPECNTYTPEV